LQNGIFKGFHENKKKGWRAFDYLKLFPAKVCFKEGLSSLEFIIYPLWEKSICKNKRIINSQ
jgi:hypothetical protein